jgi:hypothetical protein
VGCGGGGSGHGRQGCTSLVAFWSHNLCATVARPFVCRETTDREGHDGALRVGRGEERHRMGRRAEGRGREIVMPAGRTHARIEQGRGRYQRRYLSFIPLPSARPRPSRAHAHTAGSDGGADPSRVASRLNFVERYRGDNGRTCECCAIVLGMK